MEYTVVSDLFMTPTAQLADLVLPAAHWLEQDDVVFMHEVWCAMTRKKLAQIGEARDDRDVILEVAHRLGLNEAFPWPDRYAYLDWLCEGTGMRFEEFKEKDIVMGEMRYRKYEEQRVRHAFGQVRVLLDHHGARGPAAPARLRRAAPFACFGAGARLRISPDPMTGTKGLYYFHSELHQIDSLRSRRPDPSSRSTPKRRPLWAYRTGTGCGSNRPTERSGSGRGFSTASHPMSSTPSMHGGTPRRPPPEYRWKESSVNLLFGDDYFDPDSGAEPLKCYRCKYNNSRHLRINRCTSAAGRQVHLPGDLQETRVITFHRRKACSPVGDTAGLCSLVSPIPGKTGVILCPDVSP